MNVQNPPTPPPPPSPPFQFTLRTLLLLFVVLGSSMAVFGGWGIVVFGLVVGLAIYVRQAKSLQSVFCFILIVLCLAGLCWLLWPKVEDAREPSTRSVCKDRMLQIAVALRDYRDANGCFPPAYVTDKSGKPMHSWRVLILPYLGQAALYKVYDFSKPWDGPKNKKLMAARPQVFACPDDSAAAALGATQTSYLAVVGANTPWSGEKAMKPGPAGLPDGGDKTIMVVEVADSGIAWSEPRDLSPESPDAVDAKSCGPIVSSNHRPRDSFFFTYPRRCEANAVMAAGCVRTLQLEGRSTEDLRKMVEVSACPEEAFVTYDVTYRMRHLNWPNIAALAVWLLSVGTLLVGAVRARKRQSVPPPPA